MKTSLRCVSGETVMYTVYTALSIAWYMVCLCPNSVKYLHTAFDAVYMVPVLVVVYVSEVLCVH